MVTIKHIKDTTQDPTTQKFTSGEFSVKIEDSSTSDSYSFSRIPEGEEAQCIINTPTSAHTWIFDCSKYESILLGDFDGDDQTEVRFHATDEITAEEVILEVALGNPPAEYPIRNRIEYMAKDAKDDSLTDLAGQGKTELVGKLANKIQDSQSRETLSEVTDESGNDKE